MRPTVRHILRSIPVVACAFALAACGGDDGTGTAAATGGADTSDAAVQASFNLNQSALKRGVEFWNTLPHTNIPADLAAVAADLKSSGIATSAGVTAGGILATLSDGSEFVFVYDSRTEATGLVDVEAGTAAATKAPRATVQSVRRAEAAPAAQTLLTEDDIFQAPSTAATPHEMLFLVMPDDHILFYLPHTVAFANAFVNAGLPSDKYHVDATAITLDHIAAMTSSQPIDYLDVNTHGSAVCKEGETDCHYSWLSDTHLSLDSWAKYFGDIQTKRLRAGALLQVLSVPEAAAFDYQHAGWYSFAPEFLTAHLTFNPGAVIMNSSCFGQASQTASAVAATFAKAGVGLYAGWTTPARAQDADMSDAYLLDRLLGSNAANGLGALGLEIMTASPLILQRTPAQRPFPLTDILAAMQTTQRFPYPQWMDDKFPGEFPLPYNPGPHTLTESTITDSRLVFTTLNGGGDASDLVVWGLPSIATMSTIESATGATLVVEGSFPAAAGTGQIVDASGTHALSPTSWSRTRIEFPLPATGDGASGVVTVFTSEGVPSNAVPLTEWTGQLLVTVNDTASSMNGLRGTGTGTIMTKTNLHFRADVHPVVATIDTDPVRQNFAFSGMMGDATTSMTLAEATFTGANGLTAAQFGLAAPITIQTPVYGADALVAGTFIVGPSTGIDASAGCNSGLPGLPSTSGGVTAAFCPFGAIYVAQALTCEDAGTGLCAVPLYDYTGFYGYPPFLAQNASYVTGNDGLLKFTLDPATYRIGFSSVSANLVQDYLFDNDNLAIDLAATLQAPLYAPH